MKKIVVVSDSHGNKSAIDKIFNEVEFDYFLHLGDGLNDLGVYENDPRVSVVRGNCDFFSTERIDRFVVVEDVKIFMTHGDKYGVKSTLRHLYNQVSELGVDIVLYGHTHICANDCLGDLNFINPGSLSSSMSNKVGYVILTIDGKNFSIEKCSF